MVFQVGLWFRVLEAARVGHYDSFFYCSRGGHFIRKEKAVVDGNGAPRCPVHKRKLRIGPICTSERNRLYPRRRVEIRRVVKD
jgi:hypothetical protein